MAATNENDVSVPSLPIFLLSEVFHHFPISSSGEISWLFEALSVEIYAGETFGVIGPAGIGKSTLLKMMAGLIIPKRGRVAFEGQEFLNLNYSQRRSVAKRVGMTFQHSGLFDSLTCKDNLRFPLREHLQLSEKEMDERVELALEEVGLLEARDLMVHQISGGMQKRLGIARSLILSPKVVLFDDPTAGLDPITSRSIVNLITQAKEKHEMTVVIATSDLPRVFEISDRVGFLDQGKFLAVGTEQLIRESEVPSLYHFVRGMAEEESIPLGREV